MTSINNISILHSPSTNSQHGYKMDVTISNASTTTFVSHKTTSTTLITFKNLIFIFGVNSHPRLKASYLVMLLVKPNSILYEKNLTILI